jgi:formylglycine-generating enzyme required for sulfatase activity/alpha-tubulin suppressor-like RCC1 family protein
VTALVAMVASEQTAWADGTVVCWGDNNNGQVTTPVGLIDVAQVAGGGIHTVALRRDGTVVCWGYNGSGQCTVPGGLVSVVAVAGGNHHTIALVGDGTVVCWGDNSYGKCTVPTGLTGVAQISGGYDHTIAVKEDGTVVCWGRNDYLQSTVPTSLSSVVEADGGGYHTAARKLDGTVVCWGRNNYTQCTVPTGLTGVVQIVCGTNHTIALKGDGTVSCWGYNSNGQSAVPAGLSSVVQVAGGDSHTIALKSDGSVVCWGSNGSGQSVPPTTLGLAVGLAAGNSHSIAIMCDGVAETRASGELAPFSAGVNPSWTANNIEPSSTGATLTVTARGNLGTSTRFFTIRIDGQLLATNVFGSGSGAGNCTATASVALLPISAAQFASLTTDGRLVVQVFPSTLATSEGCANATLTLRIDYARDEIDCDTNGMDDACDIAIAGAESNDIDCDNNAVPDACDLAAGAPDLNGNGRLDVCEPDCNANGVPDFTDIAAAPSLDCNANGLLDICEIMDGAEDEDANGALDECQLAMGDLDLDGAISGTDLAGLLGVWGVAGAPYGDFNGDGLVNGQDLAVMLGNWGTVPWPDPPTPAWATALGRYPLASVVPNAQLRWDIVASGLPWRVKDTATQIEMLLVPPGTFQMGCSASSSYSCSSGESPVHTVTLTQAYYMGRYEVTQAQWVARMGSNPSHFVGYSDSPSRPVEKVSWNTIQGFLSATGMRLPTEAEWEYAYRAGTTTAFHSMPGYPSGTNSDSLLGTIAWYSSNSSSQTHAVGTKAGNGFGLHDMSGNVWEWVNDWSGTYASGAQTDPVGPVSGSYREIRGGGWSSDSIYCRASYRSGLSPDVYYLNFIGFRVARTP